MGWSSGSALMSEVIASMQEANIHEFQRVMAYKGIIDAFRDADCDTLDECVGEDPAFDEAFESRDSSLGDGQMNPGLPAALWKACCDSFDYAIKLRTGEVFRFTDAELIDPEWVLISGLDHYENMFPKEFNFERGLQVRLSDIVWVADAPAGS